jgi:hypothetical protein
MGISSTLSKPPATHRGKTFPSSGGLSSFSFLRVRSNSFSRTRLGWIPHHARRALEGFPVQGSWSSLVHWIVEDPTIIYNHQSTRVSNLTWLAVRWKDSGKYTGYLCKHPEAPAWLCAKGHALELSDRSWHQICSCNRIKRLWRSEAYQNDSKITWQVWHQIWWKEVHRSSGAVNWANKIWPISW